MSLRPATSRGSQWLTLVWSATSQCSALAASMARFTSASASAGAQSKLGMQRAGAENRDIGAVARHQRQRGAAGEQPLLTVPLAAKQDELDIGAVAKQLGDIQRSGDHGHGAFQLGSDGQQGTPGVEKQRRAGGDARGDLLAETLLGSGSRAFLPGASSPGR